MKKGPEYNDPQVSGPQGSPPYHPLPASAPSAPPGGDAALGQGQPYPAMPGDGQYYAPPLVYPPIGPPPPYGYTGGPIGHPPGPISGPGPGPGYGYVEQTAVAVPVQPPVARPEDRNSEIMAVLLFVFGLFFILPSLCNVCCFIGHPNPRVRRWARASAVWLLINLLIAVVLVVWRKDL